MIYYLGREIDPAEISRCLIGSLKIIRLVGELLKYGGSGMVDLHSCLQLFGVRRWYLHNGEEGLLLTCLRKVIRRIQVITEA